MKVHIDIDTRTFIRFWLVIFGIVAAVSLIINAFQAVIIIGAAFFLALALNRPVAALANILPSKSRSAGTAIAFIIIVALLGMFLLFVVPPIVEQTAKLASSAPAFIDQLQNQWQDLRILADKYGFDSQLDDAFNSVKDNAVTWAGSIGTGVISSVGSLFGFLTALLLTLVLSFLMLIEAPQWTKSIWGFYNNEARMKHDREIATKMYNVVSGYVTGQLAVSAIGAVFTGIVVFIISFLFEVPHNLALPSAAIAFVFSLIPMFGATIAGVIICLLLGLNDVTAALIFAVYFVVYQQIENNFISPSIQSKTIDLSALSVLISVTIGLYLFGIAGGIISIPIAGSIKVLVDDYVDRAKQKRKQSGRSIAQLVKRTDQS